MIKILDNQISSRKKILLVTSGQPSLNPRLVKEADVLADAGYQVTVFYAYWNEWGTSADETLLAGKKWKAIRVGGDPVQKPGIFFLSRLIHKLSNFFSAVLYYKCFANLAVARSSFFLILAARKYKADLYIGHNLGALPAIVKAAKINGALCGFDAEDFHRYEVSDDDHARDVQLKTAIENKYIPKLNYLTASSPSISAAYQKLYPGIQPSTVLNVFSNKNVFSKRTRDLVRPLQLLWFSQTVGYNRGIEDVILALNHLSIEHFTLHLLGYCSPDFKTYIEKLSSNFKIYFHDPIPPDELILYASQFDIGLALEPGFSINNDFALSNKIFTYLQAGLAVVASDTTAQKMFFNEHPGIGQLYERGNIEQLASRLNYYNIDKAALTDAQNASSSTARLLNWEQESKKFIALIKTIVPI